MVMEHPPSLCFVLNARMRLVQSYDVEIAPHRVQTTGLSRNLNETKPTIARPIIGEQCKLNYLITLL